LQIRFFDDGVQMALAWWQRSDGLSPGAEERTALLDSVGRAPLMEYGGGTWNVKDFLLRADLMRRKDRQKVYSSESIKDVAVGLAVREILLDRAKAAGMASDHGVGEQVAKARNDYLLNRWRSSVVDSVGFRAAGDVDTLRQYFENNKDLFALRPMVNAAEILVRTHAEASSIARRVQSGENFGRLAKRYSLRRSTAEHEGELGFATQEMYGPIGPKIFAAKKDAVVGPEHVDPVFGVFKILERHPGRLRTFDEAQEDCMRALLPARRERVFRKAIDALRSQGRVSIDMTALGNIQPLSL
jgi:parvulin-like peptidyl-prolyl isomerase